LTRSRARWIACRLVILDALYRFLPLDGEENSNETMTTVYNTLDLIAKRSGAGVVVVHHSSKGNQSDKSVTDVGAGGGAQSRAADTHLILRPHETDDAVVVDAAVRSFPPMAPFVIQNQRPGWALAPDLDPTLLRKPTRRGRSQTDSPAREIARVWTLESFAKEIVGTGRLIRDGILARATSHGLAKSKAESLLRQSVAEGLVYQHEEGSTKPRRFSVDPPASLRATTP